MKFFCKNNEFIRKIMIIIFLVIIILLLIIGRFRTMRVKMVGTEVWGHTYRGMETHLNVGKVFGVSIKECPQIMSLWGKH